MKPVVGLLPHRKRKVCGAAALLSVVRIATQGDGSQRLHDFHGSGGLIHKEPVRPFVRMLEYGYSLAWR